jgi:glucose 1-dehydrogenase
LLNAWVFSAFQAQLNLKNGLEISYKVVTDTRTGHHANYVASKGGVAMLMKTMAQELASKKIRINSISPGAIKTFINKSAWDALEAEASLLKLIPYGRVGVTNDIAWAIIWRAFDHSDYVNGATIYVDGV